MRRKRDFKNRCLLSSLSTGAVKFLNWLFNFNRVNNLVNKFEDAPEIENNAEEQKEYSESIDVLGVSSGSWFKDYFIPGQHNDDRPRALRSRVLIVIVVVALLAKALIAGYLFILYPSQIEMSQSIRQELFKLTNLARAECDLAPYEFNDELNKAALAKAEDMIEKGYVTHYSPDGTKPWQWIDDGEYEYSLVGENLAMNFSSAQSLQIALMDSTKHRKNILHGQYWDMGIAVVAGNIDGQETNILVSLFATAKPLSDRQVVLGERVDLGLVENPVVKMSPNLLLETQSNEGVVWQQAVQSKAFLWSDHLIVGIKRIYLAVIFILFILLLINILVRINNQRRSIIIPTVLTIVLLLGLTFTRWHILESILDKIALI